MLISCILYQMGFKENLKSELIYRDMLVKELAAKTGISRHTLDNYLNVRAHIPTLDAAVKIAQALGVTVEYLATGQESIINNYSMNQESIALIKNFNLLNEDDRNIVNELIQLLRKHRKKRNLK